MTQRLKVVKSVRFQKAIEPLLKTSMRRDTRRDTTDLNSKSIAACCDILRHKVARPSTMRVSRQCFTMFHTSVTQVSHKCHTSNSGWSPKISCLLDETLGLRSRINVMFGWPLSDQTCCVFIQAAPAGMVRVRNPPMHSPCQTYWSGNKKQLIETRSYELRCFPTFLSVLFLHAWLYCSTLRWQPLQFVVSQTWKQKSGHYVYTMHCWKMSLSLGVSLIQLWYPKTRRPRDTSLLYIYMSLYHDISRPCKACQVRVVTSAVGPLCPLLRVRRSSVWASKANGAVHRAIGIEGSFQHPLHTLQSSTMKHMLT